MSLRLVSIDDHTQDDSQIFSQGDGDMLMTTQETDDFLSHPLALYVKQIANIMLQLQQKMHSMEIKLDMIKKELDVLRPGLHDFLEKMSDAPEPSQSVLSSQFAEGRHCSEQRPFVTINWEGSIRSTSLPPSVEYKLKGTESSRTRVRLMLEALHSIEDLRTMTVTGKKMVRRNGKNVLVEGPAVPPLTLEFIYKMEVDRRKLDVNVPELMKPLKIEINGYIGKILESYRSDRKEDGQQKRKKSNEESLEFSENATAFRE